MLQEFREFALRGNVVDLAVGVVIGAGFGKIVSSLVADIVMPLLGVVVGNVDFSELAIQLKAASGERPAVLLSYGHFIQSILDFVIIAFAIFLAIKGINRLKRREEAKEAVAPPSAEQQLLAEIRDLLKAQQR
ncbi:MAG TPA: large-conductance mechanosensitive channel protein MscL [Solimonas sp.]|nr:large-conductance mechanosensitive channel protein MscL [Solimonas sp.]